MTQPRRLYRVGIFLPAGARPFVDLVSAGVRRFFQTRPRQRANLVLLDTRDPAGLGKWDGDGIIIAVAAPAAARFLRHQGVPAVNVSGLLRKTGLPTVVGDYRAGGALAAEHLWQRGLRHFGFLGWRGIHYAAQRGTGFSQWLEQRGGACSCFLLPQEDGSVAPTGRRDLGQWLATLPKPAGLLLASDRLGSATTDACRARRISIPDQLAVVGVGNDSFLCGVNDPPLSSVDPDHAGVGFRAAQMLLALMQGKPAPAAPVVVPPLRMVSRASSNVLAGPDPRVARALCLIRARLDQPLSVKELVQEVGCSRRTLEAGFRAHLGHSPLEEIQRTKMEAARQMLAGSGKSVTRIAEACGFRYTAHFIATFRRQIGTTPGRFRCASAAHVEPRD